MSENESELVKEAAIILDGKKSRTSAELRELEKGLNELGRVELAQGIRALRVGTDKRHADEALGGAKVASDALRKLERSLRADGQDEVAERVCAHRAESDMQRAELFLAGTPLKTEQARELEKSLAKDGRHDVARQVHKKRVEVDMARAVDILGNAASQPDEMFELAKSLAQYKEIGYARRVMKRARTEVSRCEYPKIYMKIFQKSALFTYKDPDLPLEWRLERAFMILCGVEDLSATGDTETLGLAGAIYKRKWEADGKRQNLERSLFYYLKGYTQCLPATAPADARADILNYLRANAMCVMNGTKDQGYNAINAAFVLDVLASQEEIEASRVGVKPETAADRRKIARLIREEIVRSIRGLHEKPGNEWLEDEWWYYATVGEAYFGLGRFEEAIRWLKDEPEKAGLRVGFGLRDGFDPKSPAGLDVPEWEYESTARQLARLARLMHDPGMTEEEFEKTGAGRALKEFLRDKDKAVRSAFRGKFGLGLSGGGFRASLFHIGVLARLAEMDVLRHVEVLSCVSGGSIIGAHYYLEVRNLLQTHGDNEIDRQKYIDIVKRTEERFLRGVQRNIRMRVLAGLYTNLKMIFVADYSRTLRVGELYEREIYSEIEDGADGKSPVTGPRWLRWLPRWAARLFGMKREERWLEKLKIHPKTDEDDPEESHGEFKPRDDNWRRANKAPILILNATSLNTGHNWQFTTTYMGEPPAPINAKIDGNYRLRRVYYDKVPRKFPPIRLGHAVAASSCVPGLFEPLILDALYPDGGGERKISVRLVDGGVCDNQGIASLLEQDCTVLLVSDGSGQMDAEDVPSAGLLGVPLRSNSILQARVREAQYGDIASRRRSDVLRGLMFIHLKQDLESAPLAWRDCPPDLKESDFERDLSAGAKGVTSFGVASGTQARLAAVRTDLDSFCDAEAYALMASAYRMTARQFKGKEPCIAGFDADAPSEKWRFNEIADALSPRGNKREQLDNLLDASSSAAFKIWKLWTPLVILKWVLVIGLAAAVVWLFYSNRGKQILPESAYDWARANLTFNGVAIFAGWTLLGVAFAAFINFVFGAARGKRVLQAIKWRDTLKNIAIGIAAGVTGVTITRLHLHVFDKIYLWYGGMKRFK